MTYVCPHKLQINVFMIVGVVGWLEGERIRDGKRGWFPSDHTMEIENQYVRRRNVCQQLRRKRSTASIASQKDARPTQDNQLQ